MAEFQLTFGNPIKETRGQATTRRQRAHHALMVKQHGSGPIDTTCGQCGHLRDEYRYFKCEVYGASASEATDWRKKWDACGAFKRKGG